MCGTGLLPSPTSSMQLDNVNQKYNSMAGAPSWALQHGGPATGRGKEPQGRWGLHTQGSVLQKEGQSLTFQGMTTTQSASCLDKVVIVLEF